MQRRSFMGAMGAGMLGATFVVDNRPGASGTAPEAFREFIIREIATWGEIVEASGAKI